MRRRKGRTWAVTDAHGADTAYQYLTGTLSPPHVVSSKHVPLLARMRPSGPSDVILIMLKIISPGSRTRDFTVVGRYNYHYSVKTFIKLDENIHGVTIVIPTNDREIPGSTPERYNLQFKITSKS